MRAKPESTIISQKSRASNLIVLVESEIKHEYCTKTLQNVNWKPFSVLKHAPGKLFFCYSLSIKE